MTPSHRPLRTALQDALEQRIHISDLYPVTEAVAVDDDATVQLLLSYRGTGRWRIELAVVAALGRSTVRPDLVLPALLQALEHPEPYVAEAACPGLGRFPGAADRLVELLQGPLDPQDFARAGLVKGAISALGAIGRSGAGGRPAPGRWGRGGAVQTLLRWAGTDLGGESPDPNGHRSAAVTALAGYPEDPRVRPVLVAALGHRGAYGLPEAAAAALVEAFGPSAWPEFLVGLQLRAKQDDAAWAVADWLKRVPSTFPPDAVVGDLLASRLPLPPATWTNDVPLLGPFVADARFSAAGRSRLLSALEGPQGTIALELLPYLSAGREQAVAVLQARPQDAAVRRALRTMGVAARAPRPAGALSLEGIVDGWWRLPGRLAHPGFAPGPGRLAFGMHERLQQAPEDSWHTDEDAVWLGWIEARGEPTLHRLPVALPSVPGGGYGAKRRWRLEAMDEGPVAVLHDPFAERGWGWRSRVLRLGWDGAWSSAVPMQDPVRWQALDPAWSPREAAWCFGEVVVWRDDQGVKALADTTPYHLDDWEYGPVVEAAFSAAAETRGEWVSLPCAVSGEDRVTVGDLHLHGLQTWLAARDAAFDERRAREPEVVCAQRLEDRLVVAVTATARGGGATATALLRLSV